MLFKSKCKLPEGMRHQILKCEHEVSPEPWVSVQVPNPISSVCVMCLCCLFVFLGVFLCSPPLRLEGRVQVAVPFDFLECCLPARARSTFGNSSVVRPLCSCLLACHVAAVWGGGCSVMTHG